MDKENKKIRTDVYLSCSSDTRGVKWQLVIKNCGNY